MVKGIIKRLSLIFISGFVSSSYAVGPGLYIGLMTGPATNSGATQEVQLENSRILIPATPKSSQWGSRAYVGYQLNPLFAFEGGVTYYSGIRYSMKDFIDCPGICTACSGVQTRVRNFDVLGKLNLGTSNLGASCGALSFFNFDIFGKAGVAVVYETTAGALNPDLGLPDNPDGSIPCGQSTYRTTVKPTFSLGASWEVTQNWLIDATYTVLMTGGAAGNVTFYSLGFSYHFVDVYCGQFLCDD